VDFGRRLSEALVGDRPSYRTERRYLHADGHVIHADVAAVLVRDADGRPMHLACQVLDITERKRLEAQVEAERDLSDRLVASLSERGALTTDPEPVAAEAVVTDVLDGLTGTVPGLRAGELTDA